MASGNNQTYSKSKVFNDPIHGQIELHPACVRIIDTPQFQRLRHIKQLDACYLVYPGASHNRFEHSIGTCHLAGKLMKALRERQPDERIDAKDILCVEIAALCHDMGQGPFSHIFEKRFMPKMKKQFKHEETARKMFEYMLEDNGGEVKKDIQERIRDCGLSEFEDKDFLFIKEMIDKPKDLDEEVWPYDGRGEEKSFMYEIVANKRNGIDVDKWDYLARDSYMLGMKVSFEHDRCIMSARVLKGNGNNGSDDTDENTESGNAPRRRTVARKQICYREKNANDLYDMFYARMTLHRRAYQHKTHRIIGTMITEALELANDTVWFPGINGSFRISDAVDDMKAFTQLTDDVFQIILHFTTDSIALEDRSALSQVFPLSNYESDPEKRRDNLNEAKDILKNILNRRLLKYVTGTQKTGESIDEDEFKDTFLQEIQSVQENTKIYYDVSYVLPDTFAEHILTIYYCKHEQHNGNALVERIKTKFQSWCKRKELPLPKGSRRQDQNTVPKSAERERQESDSDQQSRDENLELKRLAEPNTVSGNEDQQDSVSLSATGVDIRPQDTFESGDDNNSS